MTIQSMAARDGARDATVLDLTDELPLQELGAGPASRDARHPVPLAVRGWSLAHLGVSAVLALLCLGLSVIVYAELTQDGSKPTGPAASVVTKAPSAAGDQAGDPFALPPIESYAEVTGRPLFSSTRRPAPPQAAQRGSLEPASLVLTGVILVGEDRTALVQEAMSPKPTRLKEGQEIQGWLVRSILPDRIVIRRGTVEQEVKLHDDPQRTQAGAPAAAARAQ